jgi:hypothetical protein
MAAALAAGRVAARIARSSARVLGRVGWWLAWGVVMWLVLRLTLDVAGVAVTAIAAGAGLVTAALCWWAAVVEPWLFAPRPSTRPRVQPRPARPRPTSRGGVDHVAFARALSLVADRYRTECEHRASLDHDDRGVS